MENNLIASLNNDVVGSLNIYNSNGLNKVDIKHMARAFVHEDSKKLDAICS